MRSRRLPRTVFVILAMLAVAPLVLAQSPPNPETASQFYTAYRSAFEKATKVEEILPYMSKSRRAQMEKTPAGERAKMFEMIKALNPSQVKVLKETKTANGATLSVEGMDSDNKKMTGTITVVREDGAWKLDKESWSSSS